MNTFDSLGGSPPTTLSKYLPHTIGLLAAGVVASFACRLPPVHSLSRAELIGSSFERLLAVFLAYSVTAFILRLLRTGTRAGDALRQTLRTSLAALWLAPLALFIRENSVWALAVAVVFMASVARSFHLLQDRLLQSRDEQRDTTELAFLFFPSEFSTAELSPWFWRQMWSTGAALCAQAGVLAGFAGYPFKGAILMGISSAVWTWSLIKDAPKGSPQPPAPSQFAQRILVAVVIAAVFMAVGLSPYLRNTSGFGGFGVPSGRHASRRLVQVDLHGQRRGEMPSESGEGRGQPGEEKGSEDGERWAKSNTEKRFEDSLGTARDGNPGVILWPNEQTLTKLVAPAPAMRNSLLRTSRSAKPLDIPFNGVYWFFKAPDRHPPATSRQAHGTPEVLDIHSTDRRPLSMEAHEHFGSMIDLDCCSRIQIAIRNADVYPETVSLELILFNSSLPGKPSQSLGTVMVKSTRAWKLYEARSSTSETLNFPIPANPALRRFDEVMIVFRLDAIRADDGAKVAIDHFVLVPRGL